MMLIYMVYFQGIAYSMIGPSLLDLAQMSGTSVSMVSWYLSLDGLGAIAGVMIMGEKIPIILTVDKR